ncbi:MAG: hypothetical protein WCK02_15250 [Bacteroidota bacterium]
MKTLSFNFSDSKEYILSFALHLYNNSNKGSNVQYSIDNGLSY